VGYLAHVFRRPPVRRRDLSFVIVAALLLVLFAGVAGAQVLFAVPSPPAEAPTASANIGGLNAPGAEATHNPPASQPTSADQTTSSPPSQPTPGTVMPTAAPAVSPSTVAPRPTVPITPPTTAAPSQDVHAIAPEPGLPGYSPPPGHE